MIGINKYARINKIYKDNSYYFNHMVKFLTNCLEPFLSRPNESIHQAELAKLTNTKHTTLRLWLNELESSGVIKKDIKGKMVFYSINLQNPTSINHIIIAEKIKLIKKCESSLLLKELVDNLIKKIEGDILIFGSAAISFKEANDIDLLIIGKFNKTDIEQISDKINKKIHVINLKNIMDVSQTLKTEIIKKHLLIKNSEKFIGWFLW